MKRLALALCALLLCAAAPDPAERLPDAAEEARARALFAGVRCVVCQNESIDDSNADIARDLRQTIRAQVSAGRSDREIHEFLVRRYGDFILLQPRLSWQNALLWGAPFVIVLFGAGAILLRRRRVQDIDPLTPDELNALKDLDKDDAGAGPS